MSIVTLFLLLAALATGASSFSTSHTMALLKITGGGPVGKHSSGGPGAGVGGSL